MDERPVVEQVYGRVALVRYTNGYDERGVKLQSLLAVTMPKHHTPGEDCQPASPLPRARNGIGHGQIPIVGHSRYGRKLGVCDDEPVPSLVLLHKEVHLREVLLIFPQQSFLLGCLQGCIPFPRNLEVIRIATWAYTGLNARFDKGSVGLIVVGKRCYRSNIKYCWRCAQQTGDTSRSYCPAISCHAISSKVFPCLIYASARSA